MSYQSHYEPLYEPAYSPPFIDDEIVDEWGADEVFEEPLSRTIEIPMTRHGQYDPQEYLADPYVDLESEIEVLDASWQPAGMDARMIIVLGAVLLIAFGLSFSAIVLGRTIGSSGQQVAGGGSGAGAVMQQESAAALQAVLPPAVQDSGISMVFSAEVQHWAPQIIAWAEAHDLDPDMVATVMQIESCGDPNARSIAGAQGLFQVMPFHFTTGEDMLDPDTNARRGMNYLAEGLRLANGNFGLALAGYNGGHGVIGRNWDNWPSETRRYYTWGNGIYAEAKSGAETSETLASWMAAGGRSLCNQAASSLGLN